MDDLLLFNPSKGYHVTKWEDLLKGLLKSSLKVSQRKVNYLEQICNIWIMKYS